MSLNGIFKQISSIEQNNFLLCELMKNTFSDLKKRVYSQQPIFKKRLEECSIVLIISFKIAHVCAKKKMSFWDGDLKRSHHMWLWISCQSLFELEIMAAINNVQVSGSTVKRRVQDISSDLQRQLSSDIHSVLGMHFKWMHAWIYQT